ncbi:MAG: glycerophosphotransferase [Clostridia bacterium]|nr:CDP-glycerol glycerophosphotransferase family protein [Lachnospiraceae bacterium]NCC00222.1 glycerophosphotransferase [Clostridia bacterium]NCD03651.1 glycerophosphotransferase [Clostridia bacterium]
MRWNKRNIFKKVYWILCEKTLGIFRVLPIQKNKIIFDNFGGRGYGCDPKYIAEELLRRKEKLDMVWLTNNPSDSFPKGIRTVKYGGIRAMYELATARVWVDNFKSGMKLRKRKSQYYIQTWHSSLGVKMNEADAENLTRSYVRKAKRDAAMTDLMYSNNAFRAEKYRHHYWYHGPVIRCGHPRNGILIQNSLQVEEKIRNYYGIEKEKKLLLYAPTFRQTLDTKENEHDIGRCLQALSERFGTTFVCLFRQHPNVDMTRDDVLAEDIIFAGDYPDMQELMAASDVLITDYSGCMFEFMLTGKPVFLFVQDLKSYMKKERKLYFTFEELPFPMAENDDMLCHNIRVFAQEDYQRACERFIKLVKIEEDGKGAEKLSDIILEKIHEK